MLPPGRGRLATRPAPTGSETITNTIGIVRVSLCNSTVTGVSAVALFRGGGGQHGDDSINDMGDSQSDDPVRFDAQRLKSGNVISG
jgi:hypothetical protein